MSIAVAEEREAVFLGGEDDRVAKAIVRENDGLHNKSSVTLRAAEAQDRAQDQVVHAA
jgi:hypothetical protein